MRVLEGERPEEAGNVRSPEAKRAGHDSSQNGIRDVSNHIRRATLKTFVIFMKTAPTVSMRKIPTFV